MIAARRPDGSWDWACQYNDLLPDALPGSYHLKTVYHPHGGKIDYRYGHVNFDPPQTPGPSGLSVVVSGKSARRSNTQTADWSFTPPAAADSTTPPRCTAILAPVTALRARYGWRGC